MTKKFSFIIICSVVALCIGFIAGQLVEIPGFPVENLSSNISKANRYKKDLGLNQTQVIADKLMADSVFYQQTMQVLGIMSLKADASAANAGLAMEIIKQDPGLADAMQVFEGCPRNSQRTKDLVDQTIAAIASLVESGKVTMNLEEMLNKTYISYLQQEKEALKMMPMYYNAISGNPVLANDSRVPTLLSAVAIDAMSSAVLSDNADMADDAVKLLSENYREDCLKIFTDSEKNDVALLASHSAGIVLQACHAAAERDEILQANSAVGRILGKLQAMPEATGVLASRNHDHGANRPGEHALGLSSAREYMAINPSVIGPVIKAIAEQAPSTGLALFQTEINGGKVLNVCYNEMMPEVICSYENACLGVVVGQEVLSIQGHRWPGYSNPKR